MPLAIVNEPAAQARLRETRRLHSPADASRLIGISRQALDKAAERDDGPYLLWRLPIPNKRDQRYFDFGASEHSSDPCAWSDEADDPHELVTARPPGPPVHHDAESELLLRLIASGIVQLADDPGRRKTFLPYPVPLQRALDRLTVFLWRAGRTPPASVPDLIRWANLPISHWLPELAELAAPDDVLIENASATTYCREWAIESSDVEGEVVEARLLKAAMAVCRKNDDFAGYVDFRRLLIERPVLSASDLRNYSQEPNLQALSSFLREAYFPIGPEHTIDGHAEVCACGHLIVRRGRARACTNDRCEITDVLQTQCRIALAHEPVQLRPPIRTFVSLPGIAELKLARRIESLGLGVELWPAIDAYDLRVSFADGQVWAIDVKDWASPVALARHLASGLGFRTDPPWHRAMYVFPKSRLQGRPEYMRLFRHFYRGDRARFSAVSEDSLLRDIARKINGEALHA